MNLKVEKVVHSNKKKEIEAIYTSSFNKEERIPFKMMLMLAKMKKTEFLAFYDEALLVGFVYLGVVKDITYITFLAIDQALRSKGYGHQILEYVEEMYPHNKIILSIEPSSENGYQYTTRSKRKRFYLNNGFFETQHYIKLGGKKQELLIKNGIFNKFELFFFFIRYSNFTLFPRIWSKSI